MTSWHPGGSSFLLAPATHHLPRQSHVTLGDQLMWKLLKELPLEVSGCAVFSFLSVRDVVQVERAIVSGQQLVILFSIVRAGPSLNVWLGLSEENRFRWLSKNRLKVRRISINFSTMREERLPVFADLHTYVDSVFVSFDVPSPELPLYPQLCNKVETLMVNSLVNDTNWSVWPGRYLRYVRKLHISAENCMQGWLCDLLDTNPALSELDISFGKQQLPHAWFGEVSKHCSHVRALRLYGLLPGMDERALWDVAEHCQGLRTLHVGYTKRMDMLLPDGPMAAIAKNCKALEGFTVYGRTAAASVTAAVCQHCTRLTTLCLPNARFLLSNFLHLLPQHRQQPMTELECRWALQQESEVQACAALFSGLKSLMVTVPAQCEHAFAAALLHMTALQELSIRISGESGTGAILSAIADHCTQLRSISCAGLPLNHSAVATILVRNLHLRRFGWNGSTYPADDSVLHALAHRCPRFNDVRCVGVSETAVLALAAGCTDLVTVHVEDSDITDAALRGLHSRQLEVIWLINCPKVTEAGLNGLISSCRQLYYIRIVHPAFDASVPGRIESNHVGRSLYITAV